MFLGDLKELSRNQLKVPKLLFNFPTLDRLQVVLLTLV